MTQLNSIITGARSGIGLATLRKFAKNGINVWAFVHCITQEFEDEIEYLQNKYKIWIEPIVVDMGCPASIRERFSQVKKEKKRIDILVNSAGIVSPDRLFTMTRMEDVRKVMEVNYFGVIELTQMAARSMIRQRKGSIINISSIAAWGEDTSQMEYASSKAAISIATKKIGMELGRYGIRVNAIAPGLTESKMSAHVSASFRNNYLKGHSLGRFAQPEEIADICVFLASDESSFINGQTIKADGGGFDFRNAISKK